MKQFNLLRGTVFALLTMFSIGAAQAATISGTLNFGGQAFGNPGPGVVDATGLEFNDDGFMVTSASGDFASAGIGFGDIGSIANFAFSPSTAVNAFVTIGIFTFSLESIEIVDQAPMFLLLAGTGTLSGTGFDDTLYNFSLSIDSVSQNFPFSATLGPAPIPVPGALLLFMSGLTALGFRKRS